MIRLKIPLFFILFVFVLQSCDGFKIPTTLFETTERAKYERQFSGNDSLMTTWKEDFSSASKNQLKITDNYSVIVSMADQKSYALGYLIDLKKGDLLIIETYTVNSKAKIFVDVFDQLSGIESGKNEIIKNGICTRFIENDGSYKVIIQPEIDYRENFSLKIYTQPSFDFPVSGKGNRDAQSFWGASRDGGDRTHEGVDIFASRGTPVTAATDGYITRTGNQGLGGKQVWLRDENFGNALYYAHLDSIMIESGTKVKVGDTLGLVGNTGNAKGGATHLHFGIYSTGGAVDAYPFIRKRDIPKDLKVIIPIFRFLKAGSNLRNGPGTQYDIIDTYSKKIPVAILTSDGEWFHIKTQNGMKGFVNLGRLK